jgi:hypothetical protein
VIENLLVGLAAMSVNLVLQVVPLVAALRFHGRRLARARTGSLRALLVTAATVLVILVAGNLLQAGLWAGVFRLLGEFGDLETAYYHSLVNFATLGYGDLVMSVRWRLLGALEAVNGVIMIGVTTAALLALLEDALRRLQQPAS